MPTSFSPLCSVSILPKKKILCVDETEKLDYQPEKLDYQPEKLDLSTRFIKVRGFGERETSLNPEKFAIILILLLLGITNPRMDLESLETIALLDAQREYMDMNEEDALNEENAMKEAETEMQDPQQSDNTQAAETTQATQPRKRRLTSKVWNDFTPVGIDESDGKEKGQCNHCGKKLVINTRTHGTHHLSRHLETCPKKPKKVDRPVYDHKVDREMTSEIIIFHDLPFRYAEYEKVRARSLYLNPDCQPICRQTAAADVYRRYEIEKEKLRDVFAKHQGRVCFTSDLWLAKPTTMGYLCLTASFIDDNWKLHSKILAFCSLECPHTVRLYRLYAVSIIINLGLPSRYGF
ncbi:hypothetical protein Bca4012_055149 [Brassica carinata]